MTAPRVSFLVPTYNYARYLPDCLASILALEGDTAFEVVIVDDASTDDTAEVLAGIRDARVRILRNEVNLGHGRTLERALGAAQGELVARIDPDDRYRPGFLRHTLPVFERHPDVGMVYGDAALIDEAGRLTQASCDRQHGGEPFHGFELVPLLEENFICAPTVIARRECWTAFLPVPAHLAFNDWYFTVNMARRWPFYFVPEVLAEYRVHCAQHHARVARDGSEERSVRWLLDQVYATREARPELEAAKRAARKRVYARHAVDAGEKYFGAEDWRNARRCYVRALRLAPKLVLRQPVLRHLVGTLMGRRGYAAVKAAVKRPSKRREEAGR